MERSTKPQASNSLCITAKPHGVYPRLIDQSRDLVPDAAKHAELPQSAVRENAVPSAWGRVVWVFNNGKRGVRPLAVARC